MGLLDSLGTIAENTPAGLIARGIGTVLDRILPQDPAARQAAAIEVMKLQAEGSFEQKAALQTQVAQIAVNQAEAAQPGPHFRDGAGWVCVAGFGLIVLRPVIQWAAVLVGHPVTLPPIDTAEIYPMLGALLGLGGLHAVQAIKAAP
jgi:hypothetical protein